MGDKGGLLIRDEGTREVSHEREVSGCPCFGSTFPYFSGLFWHMAQRYNLLHTRCRNVERDIKDGNPQQHSPAKLEEGSENSVILDVETAPRVTVAEEAIYIVVCYCILIMIIITCGFVSFPLF